MQYSASLLLALTMSACSVYDISMLDSSGAGGVTRIDAGTDDVNDGGGGGARGGSSGATSGGGTRGDGGAPVHEGGAGGSESVGLGGGAGVGGAPDAGAAGSINVGGAGGSPGGSGGMTAIADSSVTDVSRDATTEEGGSICAAGACKRVFVTSAAPKPSGKLGGVAAADAYCQAAADAKQLGGTWRAWLSDTSTSPSVRFRRATVPYRLLDGNTIASDWTSLVSGALQHVIDVDEEGTVPMGGAGLEVWTGTKPNGTYSGQGCAEWTSDTNGTTGDVGLVNQTSGLWTNAHQDFCGKAMVHLYCFEQ